MVEVSRGEALFIADTLRAIRDKKSRVSKKHYRTTIYKNQIDRLINEFEKVK